MRVLAWHVDPAWMTSFVQGPHEYFVPVLKERGAFGRGRPPGDAWPGSAVELPPRELAQLEVDVVVLQRPQELGLATSWLGRKPGIDIPAVYVEHEAPRGPSEVQHPIADHPELTLVHVAHFNRLFWNAGSTPTRVIEPGITDPGYRYCGDLPHAVVVREYSTTRTAHALDDDLIERFGALAPLDVLECDPELDGELARRSVYLHLSRWSSLGRSLLQAMHLGMPVVALATHDVPVAVPPSAGIVSNCIETLEDGLRHLLADPARARRMGRAARRVARERYGLERFLHEWDDLLETIAHR
jgi:glycosyltransferase involved in cell wall biosynthesis